MYKPFVFFGLIMKFFFNCPSMAVLIIVNAAAVSAQTPDCYATRADVATVRLTAAGRLHDRPVVDLGSGQELDLSFDMIDADVRTLYYSFALCNADWSPSDLLEIEYVAGINRFYGAESAALSFNTTTDYVHYDLTVGTDALLLSGNYLVSVYSDDDGGTLLLRRPFCVTEKLVGIDSRIFASTASGRLSTQKIQFTVRYADLRITDPHSEIAVRVEQNGRTDNCLTGLTPTFVRSGELVYDAHAACLFEGGNEFRWLDTRSIRATPPGVQSIEYHEPYYHFELYPDGLRTAYSFYNDINGSYALRAYNVDADRTDTEADYVFVHLTYTPEPEAAASEIYVVGALTDWQLSASNRMTPAADGSVHRLTLRLKQGYYNYMYVSRNARTGAVSVQPMEGSFEQTENDYYIFVYYRPLSGRSDRLAGFVKVNSQNAGQRFIH